MTFRILEPWVLAYVVAGMAHYLKLLRAAAIAEQAGVEGDLGRIMRHGLTRASFSLFLGVVASWPIAAWRGRHRSFFEIAVFLVAGVLLTILAVAWS